MIALFLAQHADHFRQTMSDTTSTSSTAERSRFGLSGTALVLLAAISWGTTGTAQSFAPPEAPSPAIGALRLFVGGLTLLLIVMFSGSLRQRPNPWPWRANLTAAFAMAVYQVTFFAGVRLTGVAIGTIVGVGSAPIFTGLLDYVLYRRAPGRRWLIATGLAVIGCALLTFGGSTVESSEAVKFDPLGILLTLTAGFSYAIVTIASKGLLKDLKPDAAMAAVMSIGALFLLPFWVGTDLSWLAKPNGLLVVLHLGVITIAIGYILFARGLALIPASTVVTLTLAEPLTAGILGVVVVGEILTPLMLLGAGMVFAGLVVLSASGEG